MDKTNHNTAFRPNIGDPLMYFERYLEQLFPGQQVEYVLLKQVSRNTSYAVTLRVGLTCRTYSHGLPETAFDKVIELVRDAQAIEQPEASSEQDPRS